MRLASSFIEFIELGGFGALMLWLVMVSALGSGCTQITGSRGAPGDAPTQVLGCDGVDGDGGGGEGGDHDVMIALVTLAGCGGADADQADVGLIGEVGDVDLNDPETRAAIEAFWADQKIRSAIRAEYRELTDEQFQRFFGSLLKGLTEFEQADFLEYLKIAEQMRAPGGSIMDENDVKAATEYFLGLRRQMAELLAEIASAAAGGSFPTPEQRRAVISVQNRINAMKGTTYVIVEEKTRYVTRQAGGTSSTNSQESSTEFSKSLGMSTDFPIAPGLNVDGSISTGVEEKTKAETKTTKERPAYEFRLEVTVVDVKEPNAQELMMPMPLTGMDTLGSTSASWEMGYPVGPSALLRDPGDGPHHEPSEKPSAPRDSQATPRRNVVFVRTFFKWVHPCMLVDRTDAERAGEPVAACPPAPPPNEDPSTPLPENAGSWVRMDRYQRGAYIYLDRVFPSAFAARKDALLGALERFAPMLAKLEAIRADAAAVVKSVTDVATRDDVTVQDILAAGAKAKAKAESVCGTTLLDGAVLRETTLASRQLETFGEEYLATIGHLEGLDNVPRLRRFWAEEGATLLGTKVPELGAEHAICAALLAAYESIPLRIQKEKADGTATALTAISDAVVADQLLVARTMKRADLRLEALGVAQQLVAPLRSARTHSRYSLAKELAAGADAAFATQIGSRIDADHVLTQEDKDSAKADALAAIKAEKARWSDLLEDFTASDVVLDHVSLVQARLEKVRTFLMAKNGVELEQLYDVWHGTLSTSGLGLAGACVVRELRLVPGCWKINEPRGSAAEGAGLAAFDDELTLLERAVHPFEAEVMGLSN